MINYDLRKIKAICLDVDGVLSEEVIRADDDGRLLRSTNTKDGYAIHLAAKSGLLISIISGAYEQSIRLRYEAVGIKDIRLGCADKTIDMQHFLNEHGLKADEVLYMGDDIPDYRVMRMVGVPCCPADAASEIRDISLYVSHRKGGQGCVRDVLEQVLRAQGKWMADENAFGW